jgi:hypothetical protein
MTINNFWTDRVENSQVQRGPDEEDAVITFEESSNKMEAEDLDETLEVTVAENQELRILSVKVENFGALKGKPFNQHLAEQSRRRKLKNRKKLAARKRIICRTVPAARKGHIRGRTGKGSFTTGISNGRTLEIRRQTCHNEIRNRVSKEELSQRMGRTSDMSIRKKQWMHLEYNSGIKGRCATQQIHIHVFLTSVLVGGE